MKNKKILLIICLVIIVLVLIITNIYIQPNKPKENQFNIEGIENVKNEEILKDTAIEELAITNISLLTRDGISTYKAIVTNTNTDKVNIDKLYVIFKEESQENKILALSNINLGPNSSTNITITSESDLSKITSIQYVIEKNDSE